MKVLTHYYDAYAGLGNIFTRHSGGTRRIEIELFFSPDTTAGQMEAIRNRMDNELKQSFGTIEFYLIARCLDS